MPYSDRWQITATKLGANTYAASHPDSPRSPVTVVVPQILANELINVGGALMLAIQALYPMFPPPWENRYRYAVCRWKMDAYQSLISGASGQLRNQLTAKRNVWVAEEARLKAIMGSDA